MLRDQGEIASRHGQTAFAILLMQDLAVVPLLALEPILADSGPLPKEMPLVKQIAGAIAMVALVIVTGRYLVPRLLDYLARRNTARHSSSPPWPPSSLPRGQWTLPACRWHWAPS